MAPRGVKKIVREIEFDAEIGAIDAWMAIQMLADSKDGFDKGQKLVRYHRHNYKELKEDGDVHGWMMQDEPVELWKVIVEHSKTLWAQLHRRIDRGDGYDEIIYHMRCDETDGMEGMLKELEIAGKIQAAVIAGQVIRWIHNGELDMRGQPIEYEFVNICEKKVVVKIAVAKDAKRNIGNVYEVERDYAWQVVIGMLESRMDEREQWIRARAVELCINLNEMQSVPGHEALRIKWNKELVMHGKSKNLCVSYLGGLHSELVGKYIRGEIGVVWVDAPNGMRHGRLHTHDGVPVTHLMSKNTGEGPKVEPVNAMGW